MKNSGPLWAFAAALGVASFGGCAGSLRTVYEGNRYFERCYGADFDSQLPSSVKKQCWSRWLRFYSDVHDPDKLRYARHRLQDLERSVSPRPLPGLGAATKETGDPADSTTADQASAPGAAAGTQHTPPTHGSVVCRGVCQPRWDRCTASCQDQPTSCIRACETEYRACTGACF